MTPRYLFLSLPQSIQFTHLFLWSTLISSFLLIPSLPNDFLPWSSPTESLLPLISSHFHFIALVQSTKFLAALPLPGSSNRSANFEALCHMSQSVSFLRQEFINYGSTLALEDHPCRLCPALHSINFRLIQDVSMLRTPHTLLIIGLAIDKFLVIVMQFMLLKGYRFWEISYTDLKQQINTNWATSGSRVKPRA